MAITEQQEALKKAIEELLDNSALDTVVGCAVPITDQTHPRTALLHVKFNEDKPQVNALARFLWNQSVNYALSRRRRLAFRKALENADPADMSSIPDLLRTVRDVFIEFRKANPSRASEVGEVLAYCVTLHHLKAAQMAAKMSLKTSPNMPVHGLDGIHAIFETGALTIYFLESKLAGDANDGARDYADSVAGFLKNEKQYLREYELVGDLGNLDALQGEARDLALQHFDVVGKPDIPRRERSVGVICYSEKKHFANIIPVADGPVDVHEKHFTTNFAQEHSSLQQAVSKHLKERGADPNKCLVFFVAVPDVIVLRENFYAAMGISDVQPMPDKPKRKVTTKPKTRSSTSTKQTSKAKNPVKSKTKPGGNSR